MTKVQVQLEMLANMLRGIVADQNREIEHLQGVVDELLAALKESKCPKRDALLKLYGKLATMG